MCSETTSPRISFSDDLAGNGSLSIGQHGEHGEHGRQDLTLMDSSLEFEFSFNGSIEHESSSADELFSNGIILPIKIQDKVLSQPPLTASLPPLPPTGNKENSKETMKQVTEMNSSNQLEQKTSKSFWIFKRSSSLNFERASLCPLPLLSRSNSTGSAPNPKPRKLKDSQKQNSQKLLSTTARKSFSSCSSSSSLNQYPVNLKPQQRKNLVGLHGHYHCISPVLNVPPSKFLGLASLLRSGKDKKGKK